MTWVRVRDRDTGHQYDVDARALDPAAHEPLLSPRYPDLQYGPPRPPKHRVPKGVTTKAGQPATSTSKGTS